MMKIMFNELQNRFKSKVLWVSIFALIALVAKTFFDYEIPNFDMLTDTILALLIALGVINNPTNGASV